MRVSVVLPPELAAAFEAARRTAGLSRAEAVRRAVEASVARAQVREVQPVLMVRDVAAAVAFYARIGFPCGFVDDPARPLYAAVRRGGAELHLQWHDASAWASGGDRPTYRLRVADPDAVSAELDAGPGLDRTPVWDTAWGTRELHLRDPDGNGLQFYRPR